MSRLRAAVDISMLLPLFSRLFSDNLPLSVSAMVASVRTQSRSQVAEERLHAAGPEVGRGARADAVEDGADLRSDDVDVDGAALAV